MGVETWLKILPDGIREALNHLPVQQIYELRLRVNATATVTIDARSFTLPTPLISREDLDNVVHRAAEYAIYAVLDQMVQGFITIRGGVRIGIAGELVLTDGQVTAVANISSLCIRLPHQVKNCAYPVLPYLFDLNRPYKTLVIAPPGAGKTTLLRDLAKQIGVKYPQLNTLLLDERGELAAAYQGENQLDVGPCDVITGGNKSFGFLNGLRSLRPDCVITDEIATADDAAMVRNAARSGVVVIASTHAADLDEVRHKPYLGDLFNEGVFDRYVVLTTGERAGEVVGVFDRGGRRL